MIVLFSILALSILSFWFAAQAAKRHHANILCYEHYSSQFYRSSKSLLSNEDTPEIIIGLLGFMNSKMPNANSARQFIFNVLSVDKDVSMTSKTYDQINLFFKERPELERPFDEACQAALRALSYRSLIAGPIIRRIFLFDDAVSHERPAQLVVRANQTARYTTGGRQHLLADC